MTRRAFAFGLLLAVLAVVPSATAQMSISGSAPAIACDSSAAISIASSGSTEIVGLTAGTIIYVCAWDVVADGTVAVKWVYGTGTNCATGAVNLDGARAFIVNSGIAKGTGYGVLFKTAVSNALCINLSASIGARGHITYAKF
jgi:hypothetical protein